MDKIQNRGEIFSPAPRAGGVIRCMLSNPRASLLQLLLLFNKTAVCGREVNRPSELCVRRIVVQELTLFYCVGLIQYCEGVIPSL